MCISYEVKLLRVASLFNTNKIIFIQGETFISVNIIHKVIIDAYARTL